MNTSIFNHNKALTVIATNGSDEHTVLSVLSAFFTIIGIQRLHCNVWKVVCPSSTILSPELRLELYNQKWDFALQNEFPADKKLFMSDMDATIVVGETIDEMAQERGIYDEISKITESAMRGQLNYSEALQKRLSLLKGMHKDTLERIARNTVITAGANRLLAHMNNAHIHSCLISGGFTIFTECIANKLGFTHHHANTLSYDEHDILDGNWSGELVTAEVKERTLREMAKEYGYNTSQTISIGDGANDIPMVKSAGLGVAFYGKPALRDIANAEIHSGNIDNILWFI